MELVIKAPTERKVAMAVINGKDVPCLVGRAGVIDASRKMEGDGKTPLGRWRVLYGLYRADRVSKPMGGLVWRPLRQDDGWCDDANDPLYNQPVPTGYGASHEVLWRKDEAYDYILVLDHNQPAVSGCGSAIFVHLWREGATHTEGCVALKRADMEWLVAQMGRDAVISIG